MISENFGTASSPRLIEALYNPLGQRMRHQRDKTTGFPALTAKLMSDTNGNYDGGNPVKARL